MAKVAVIINAGAAAGSATAEKVTHQGLGVAVLSRDPRPSLSAYRSLLLRWMDKVRAWHRGALWCVVSLLLAGCDRNVHLTFLDPQGPIADAQRWHFYEVLGIMAVLVAGPIFLLLPFFAWRYRYGAKTSRYTPNWEFSQFLEITAWGGPIVIVIVLSFFVWRDTHRLDPYKALASHQAPLHVQVIGYDWKWLFIYPDQGIASIGTLAVPAGRPISIDLTSATVMQSLFIPALGSQIYAMGGMVTQLNLQASKPGRSLGENTMYNGNGFHQQQFTAQAMTPANFKAWVSKVRATGIPLDARTLQLISRRATRSDLIAALPKARSMDGNVYFTGASKALFPAVVKATMDGKSALPQATFEFVSTTTPVVGRVSRPMADQKQ
jgi:cytochrome o ubiquinol oxidase subunit 2